VAFQSGSACAAAKRRQRETVALNSLPLRETVATYSTRISIGCNTRSVFAEPALFFFLKKKRQQQPGNRPGPPSGMHPSAPQMQPLRPRSMRLFRLVLARSRGPSESQASHFLAHLALLVPPEALCSPATSPKFSKRGPYGARLAPATGGAPATFSAAAARLPQQSSRRGPGGGFNLRPAPLFLLGAGGRVASQSYSNHAWQT
jgi:hypothetical protein